MPLLGDYEPSPDKRAREQVALYEASGGTKGNTIMGMPVVVITSVGAKSGNLRKTPLMRVEHEGVYAVVASNGGSDVHPVWYYNLLAEPNVELQDGPAPRDMRARLASGDERSLWWDRAVAAFSYYAGYAKKAAREIPVFIIEPAAEPGLPQT